MPSSRVVVHVPRKELLQSVVVGNQDDRLVLRVLQLRQQFLHTQPVILIWFRVGRPPLPLNLGGHEAHRLNLTEYQVLHRARLGLGDLS